MQINWDLHGGGKPPPTRPSADDRRLLAIPCPEALSDNVVVTRIIVHPLVAPGGKVFGTLHIFSRSPGGGGKAVSGGTERLASILAGAMSAWQSKLEVQAREAVVGDIYPEHIAQALLRGKAAAGSGGNTQEGDTPPPVQETGNKEAGLHAFSQIQPRGSSPGRVFAGIWLAALLGLALGP